MRILLGIMFLIIASSCSKSDDGGGSSKKAPLAPAHLTAGAYVPNSGIIGNGSVKGSVTTTTTTFTVPNAGMVRLNDPWGSREILIDLGTFTAGTDFGLNGSITLTAQALNYPTNGGAYPVLSSFYSVVSPSSTLVEYVNVTSNCQSTGMWTCTSGSCTANSACTVQNPSAFLNRTDWDQHQIPNFGYVTTNSFPRCDSSVNGWSACPSTLGWGALPSGHYYAKYILLSDSSSTTTNLQANLKVTMQVKKDTTAPSTGSVYGGININFILVGDKNISDSKSTKGANNLDMLLKEVNRLFSNVSGAKLFLNQIKVYEWSNADGASQYSQLPYTSLGDLFESGSGGVDAADNLTNINVFLVSDIEYPGSSLTILGLSGGILGPPTNGTQTSGLAFSSSNRIATFNPGCSTSNCARNLQENDFLEMGATIVHEMGHYLGLNHPSESPSGGSQQHDQLSDTPKCIMTSAFPAQRDCYYIDSTTKPAPLAGTSCQTACDAITGVPHYMNAGASSGTIDSWTSHSNTDMPGAFCPTVPECQFNHIMWYTTKNRKLTAGTWNEDGNLFSAQSSALLQWNSFLR